MKKHFNRSVARSCPKNTTPLYPSRLRRPIMNLLEGKESPVYLGNESVGDPEITE